LEALEEKVKLPLALPPDAGAKTTAKDVLWPAASARGRAEPLTVKLLLPVTAACDIVRIEPPELVRVVDCGWLLPTGTFVKFRLLILALSFPGADVGGGGGAD
jgi:hypothetical protein